jgi:LmbE family N-acetylglucosaminyl deacetylase
MPNDLPSDRLLVLAPHPDDEAIAAGALIQRALARGSAVHVALITDGRENPWPQRYTYRRWFLTDADRAAWGAMRREEALQSLATLGVPAEAATFLDFPDSRLADLARQGDARLTMALRELLRRLRPSLLVSPSAQDLHSDHRAVAWFAHQAVRELGDACPEIATYVIHGEGAPDRLRCRIELTSDERDRKRAAIECHRSQLLLSRKRFLSYAGPTELFFGPEPDLVCTESRAHERISTLRHALRVITGRSMPSG